MASELLRIPTASIQAVSTPPAVRRPFSFSHFGQYLSMFRRLFGTESVLVPLRGVREFCALFFALNARFIQSCQVRPRLSKQVGTRFTFIRRADFRTVLCTHRTSARAGTFGNCEIRQRPAQTETSKNPAFFCIQNFFVGKAMLKHKNFIKQSVTLERLDPVRFVRSFFFRQHVVASWAIKAVTRFSNVANFAGAWVDESVDKKTVGVSVRHAVSSITRRTDGDLYQGPDSVAFEDSLTGYSGHA